ncbi:MAG: thioredoxin-like domain-containing protein [Anaerolineae bacterium]
MASKREYHGNIHAPEFPANAEWVNTNERLSLAGLRGKLVLLDFWTYGCINCMHILPDLKRLEELYANELVVIGVHSAKFENEGNLNNLRQIIARYEITHPVVNDRDYQIWQQYAVRAWPTTVLIDPRGLVLAAHSGEGVYAAFAQVIHEAVERFEREGVLDHTKEVTLSQANSGNSFLSFPGKVIVDSEGERLFIADTGHNRVVMTDINGVVLATIGSGQGGLKDGAFTQAQFNKPQGMAVSGERLYIADTGNHALRLANLNTLEVTTLAGDGELTYSIPDGSKGLARLNSPWDLLLRDQRLYIAMAGLHQVYIYDLQQRSIRLFAGSGREALVDAWRQDAAMAQPSGLAANDGSLYIADSEASAIREIEFGPSGQVHTLLGAGLFDFGDVDGNKSVARLQHSLGVAYADGELYIADTYNHKIKVFDIKTGVVRTLFGGGRPGSDDGAHASFYEPGGLAVFKGQLYIADTNNHAIRIADISTHMVKTLNVGLSSAEPTNKPAVSTGPINRQPENRVHSGEVGISLQIMLPEGHHLTEGQPSQLMWTMVDAVSGMLLGQGSTEFTELEPYLLLTVPEGNNKLAINLTIYYCDDIDGLCLMERCALELPLHADALTLEHQVTIPLAIS